MKRKMTLLAVGGTWGPRTPADCGAAPNPSLASNWERASAPNPAPARCSISRRVRNRDGSFEGDEFIEVQKDLAELGQPRRYLSRPPQEPFGLPPFEFPGT